jgi:hypothetical protein
MSYNTCNLHQFDGVMTDCNIVAILSTLEISDLIVCLFKLKLFVVSISNRTSFLSFGFLLLSES